MSKKNSSKDELIKQIKNLRYELIKQTKKVKNQREKCFSLRKAISNETSSKYK